MNDFCIRFNKPIDANIVGFSVSKKIGKAVIRNLVKRRFRAICIDGLKYCKRCVFIIIAKSDTPKIPFQELKQYILSSALGQK